MRYVTWGLGGLLGLIVLVFLHYTLPRQDIVRIVNTEVQRIDTSGSWFYAESEGAGSDGTRDVKIIHTIRDGGKPAVYRNEDTGWGWPPFFKFNSSNLQATASDMTSTSADPQWVLIKRYGWRNQFFSIYPNVVSIKAVDGPDEKPLPWGNVIVLLALVGAGYGVYRTVDRFWDRRVDPMIDNISDVFDGKDDDTDTDTGTAAAPQPAKKSLFARLTGR